MTTQTLVFHNRVHRPVPSHSVSYGVPWQQGAVSDPDSLSVRRGETLIPAAFTVLNSWPDGSAQWTLAEFALDFEPSETMAVTIGRSTGEQPPSPAYAVTAEVSAGKGRIGNGLVDIAISAETGCLLTDWQCRAAAGKDAGMNPLMDVDGMDITFLHDGRLHSLKAGPRSLSIEHATPLRAVLRVDGKHGDGDGSEPLLDYFLRFEVFAGRPDVRITYSFRNRELPTPGLTLETFDLTFDTTVAPDARRCFTASNRTRYYRDEWMRVSEDPRIVASDTGDLEHYRETHTVAKAADCFVANPEVLHDPHESKPWFLRDQQFRKTAGGEKCVWPYLGLIDDNGGILTVMESFKTLYPKELTVQGSRLRYGLYPDWAGPLEITQGAGRSHVVWVGPLAADDSDAAIQNHYLGWELGGAHTHVPSCSTVEIQPDLEHVRQCGVFGLDLLPAYDPDGRFKFERKVLDAWIGVSYGQLGATDQVKPHPAAGFWDYGDEGRGNNEEMVHLVYFQNYLRTGNFGCLEVAMAGTRHLMEVDHVAFSVDSYQNGGMCAHCLNHNTGASYPSHIWYTELLFAYALTGDQEYKAAALRLCENLLMWVDDAEGFRVICADQREAGQPMINLTWCYEFNRDPRYLEACSKIAREALIASAAEHGRMLNAIPYTMPLKIASYGDYASWEGLFWYWRLTGDEEIKRFFLEQMEWRLTERYCGVHGFHRTTDYNPVAYAYLMSGDRRWVDRVARPLRAAFSAANWPLGWVHAMYAIKVAFDLDVLSDDDVLVT